MQKFQKRLQKKFLAKQKLARKLLRNNILPLFLIFIGLVTFIFGGINYYRVRVLSFTKTPQEAQTTLKGELPTEINIPSIGISLPIEVGTIKDGVWQVSDKYPTFLDSSARPGTNGNTIIYGHNKKVIFGNLPYLSLGQKIYVKTTDNKIHVYEAYKKDFVSPDRVDLVDPTNKEELTIYTCWGLFDNQRVVIKAKPSL